MSLETKRVYFKRVITDPELVRTIRARYALLPEVPVRSPGRHLSRFNKNPGRKKGIKALAKELGVCHHILSRIATGQVYRDVV